MTGDSPQRVIRVIGGRLQILRKEKGYNKRDLVRVLPINYSTYANYESGIREPSFEILQIIAEFYNVSVDYILGVTDKRRRIDDVVHVTDAEYTHLDMYRRLDDHGKTMVDLVLEAESKRYANAVPLVPPPPEKNPRTQSVTLQVFNQRASAGLGNYLDDYSDEDYEMLQFSADCTSLKADFAVRLKGDSMEPKYMDGDVVCVKSVPHVDPEQIGIFIYDGEAYCKRLKINRRRESIYLESINVFYPPILIQQPDQLKTVGLVLGIAEPFDFSAN